MNIAKVETFRIYPKVIKEAWVDDEYVWPSQPPSFVIKVTAENATMAWGKPRARPGIWARPPPISKPASPSMTAHCAARTRAISPTRTG